MNQVTAAPVPGEAKRNGTTLSIVIDKSPTSMPEASRSGAFGLTQGEEAPQGACPDVT
jgi:hypothetical protein